MSPNAFLHGDPGRLPFLGHFRADRAWGQGTISVAGRIHSRGDVVRAFRAARLIESAVQSTSLDAVSDRHQALAAVWQQLYTIDACDFGTDNGSDLVVLFVSSDTVGTGISGVGLGGVWALEDDVFAPLVQGDHPLLSGPGRPEQLAGVLTLDQAHGTIVGVPHDHTQPPKSTEWQQKCGVHP